MTRERYLILKEEALKLDDIRFEMIIANQTDTDKFQEIVKRLDEIDNEIRAYLTQKVEFLINNNLAKDLEKCLGMLSYEETYSIGYHHCGYANKIMSEEHLLAESLLQKGLISARREGGGILEDVYVLGTADIETNISKILQELYKYAVYSEKGGVVVSIPSTMLTRDGERVSIGEFPNDLDFVAKDDKRCTSIPINKFVNRIGYLPPEFILGVVSNDINGEPSFTINNRYISILPEEEQIALYEKFVSMGLHPYQNRSMSL